MSTRLPAIFLGHGNPMNAVARNRWTDAWARLGLEMGKPRAVVCISAHWYGPGCGVTAMEQPRTIHDFDRFPPELFGVQYPAPGSPPVARRVQSLLGGLPKPVDVPLDTAWGLDHGTWSVLCHVFPDADVPTVQLRIDARQPPDWHYAIGRALAPLREEGVLLVGSGNLVHNLMQYDWDDPGRAAWDWAARFESRARTLLAAGEHSPLIHYRQLGEDATLSIPTPEHYLPLLYVLGAQCPGEDATFPVDGVDGGGISMLAVRVG